MSKKASVMTGSANPPTPRVFVIYGRNLDAYKQMKRFLKAIEVSELTFDEVANCDASPYVTEIAIAGIQKADAVIALFTPDELAVLYQQDASTLRRSELPHDARWQPRANVVFEAGIAFALKKDRTILVSLGDAVTGFSDIGGIHLVRIDSKIGKRALRRRLQSVLKNLPELSDDWELPENSGDFESCVPRRWRFYDELWELESFLNAQSLIQWRPKKSSKRYDVDRQYGVHSLLDIVELVVKSTEQSWRRSKPRQFMKHVRSNFDNKVTDDAYWWLVVAGFFQFQDTERWFDSDDNWTKSVDYVTFSARGLALIDKIRS